MFIVNKENYFFKIDNFEVNVNELVDCKIFTNKDDMLTYVAEQLNEDKEDLENGTVILHYNEITQNYMEFTRYWYNIEVDTIEDYINNFEM